MINETRNSEEEINRVTIEALEAVRLVNELWSRYSCPRPSVTTAGRNFISRTEGNGNSNEESCELRKRNGNEEPRD